MRHAHQRDDTENRVVTPAALQASVLGRTGIGVLHLRDQGEITGGKDNILQRQWCLVIQPKQYPFQRTGQKTMRPHPHIRGLSYCGADTEHS